MDTDNDGVPDYLDLDSDGDRLFDVTEAGVTDTNNGGILDLTTDNDSDGLDDSVDPDQGGTALTLLDADSDGIVDYLESAIADTDLDELVNQQDDNDDGDSQSTSAECPKGLPGAPCPDTNNDGIPNYLESDTNDQDFDGKTD
ncbi:MAG: hypothetical protein GKR87_10400 [Kiritimatiellae bacterium]|nr:hypothetical protein [Kiritimatiellia bacterium]